MKGYYALFYDVTDDYLERRGEFRAEHLRLAEESRARGEMVLGGAFSAPADQAMLVFRCDGPETAEEFAKNDPYVKHGLVVRWRVREWKVVIGAQP